MELLDHSLDRRYVFKRKVFYLPKTKHTHAKQHFYKKINFMKKRKTIRIKTKLFGIRKNPLKFSLNPQMCYTKLSYIPISLQNLYI